MNYNEIIKSAVGGQIATVVFLIVGYIFDKSIDPDLANIIALLAGGITNYFLQSYAFSQHGPMSAVTIIKFAITDAILYSYEETAFIYFHNKFVDDTMARIVVAIFGFIFISYPMRKYFVFNSKYDYLFGTK